MSEPLEKKPRSAPILARALGALSFLLPLICYGCYMLNHFYRSGAYMFDSGVYAYCMWRDGVAAHIPDQHIPYLLEGGSYYAIHFTPIYGLVSLLSYCLPLNHVELFATFIGSCYGLMSLAIYWLLAFCYAPTSRWGLGLALLCSQAFAFSGLSVAIVMFPHCEILAVGALIFFFGYFARQRYALASLWFLLALLVREDVGCHCTAILGLVLLYQHFCGGRSLTQNRALLFFVVAGAAWTALAIGGQRFFLGGGSGDGGNALGRLYTAGMSLESCKLILRERIYLWLPVVLALVTSGRSRPYQALAILAFLPWVALQLHANRPAAQTLFGYYAYPFLLSWAWILLDPLWCNPASRLPCPGRAAAIFLAVNLLSLVSLPFERERDYLADFWAGSKPGQDTWGFAARQFCSAWQTAPPSGAVRVDMSILSLLPRELAPGTWRENEGSLGEALDTLVFFRPGNEWASMRAAAVTDLPRRRCLRVGDSNIVLLQNPQRQLPAALQAILAPTTFLWVSNDLIRGQAEGGHYYCRPELSPGVCVLATFSRLKPGRYRASYDYRSEGSGHIEMKALADHGNRVLAVSNLPFQGQGQLSLEFGVDEAAASHLDIALESPQEAPLTLEDFDLRFRIWGWGGIP